MIVSLAGLSLSELEKILNPLPRFRAKQIYNWIIRGASDFSQLTDIPASLREELKSRFCFYSSSVTDCHDDKDTKKILLTLKDASKIEAVLLNDGKNRFTACLSTQAGCPVKCVFCKTGSLGFKRNLDHPEIVEQFLFLRNMTENKSIDNIVVMGMGEPLLNLEQLRPALLFFTDRNGMNFSRRRITISTCGICEGLLDLVKNGPYVRLALSLATADEALRQKLIPAARTNPLKKIKESLAVYQQKSGSRLTLEIPLLQGINTRDKDAQLIADFAKGLDTVINIIPWNPVAGLEFENQELKEPDKKETGQFIQKLETLGLKVTTRYRKGQKVAGACGQLGTRYT